MLSLLLLGTVLGLILSSVVRTVWDDDPVLRSHLSLESPGWRALPYHPECEEEDPLLSDYCARHLAETGGCVDSRERMVVVRLISLCRRHCRQFYANTSSRDLPLDISDRGGLQDFLPQPFGFELPVCSLTEGYHHKEMLTKQVDFVHHIPELSNFAPAFTEIGFLKTKVPESLHRDIMRAREQALQLGLIKTERADYGILNGPVVIENPILQQSKAILVNRTQMIQLNSDISKSIFEVLGPLAEEWADLKLTPTSLYGIRRYRNMSTLASHVDRISSHVISAIINVDQEVEEDWPLYIMDNEGEEQVVVMEPGDMVWYESARLTHGRQRPLRGRYYDNIFCHFMPRGLWYPQDILSPEDPVMKISAEAVRWSQRRYGPTDWSKAWRSFVLFKENEKLSSLGLAHKFDQDPEDEVHEKFVHIQPA